jgi:GDP-4-dehydro-6-deoxy-D-mannose reductase
VPGTILVTGAAGFAGSHLVDLLAREGREIVAWQRHGPEGDHLPRIAATPPGVAVEQVDVLDSAMVRAAVARVRPSAVYHCAGAAHVGRSWTRTETTFLVNVRGTHHLLEALRFAGIKARFFVPSSAMVYRSADEPLTEDHPLVPESPYGVSKLAQELLACRAMADGIDVIIARSFNHFGPRQAPSFVASSFARQIAEIESGRRDPELLVGNLDARRDLTDVRDTVRAYVMLVEHGRSGRPYNVCSGRAVTIRELLDRLLSRARTRIKVRVDAGRYRPNDVPLVLGDPSRIQREVGWAADISLERTIDDLLEYWRSEMIV